MEVISERALKNLLASCIGLLVVVLFSSACSTEEPNCTRLWNRLSQCGLTNETKIYFVQQCDPGRPYTADLIDCSASAFCADFRFCHERALLDDDVRSSLRLMNESIAKNEFFLAVTECNNPMLLSRPQMKAKCQYTLQRSLSYYKKLIFSYLDNSAPPVGATGTALHHSSLLLKTAGMIGLPEKTQTFELFDRITRRNPGDALTWCDASREYLTRELADRCAPVPALAHAANVERALAVQRALDAPVTPGSAPPPKPDTFSVCYDLKRTGQRVGPAQLKDAELICTELDLQAYVAAVMPAVEVALLPKKPALALECMPPYINSKFKLDELTSPFAASQKKKLFDACYSRLGVVVLDYLIPRTKGECEFSVLLIYHAVKTYGLTDPELTGRIRLVEKHCSKSVVLLKEYL